MSDAPASRSQTRLILLASLAAAISSFLILSLAARSLDPEQNRQFLVFWALLFGVFGVLSGIQHETTRAVSEGAVRHGAGSPPATPAVRSVPVVRSALVIGVAAAAVICGTSPLWAPVLLPTASAVSAALIAAAAGLYAGHGAVAGAAAGTRDWGAYAALMAAETLLRLLVVGLVLLAALVWGGGEGHLLAAQAGTAAAAALWLLLLAVSSRIRRAAGQVVRVAPAALLGRRLAAMFTAGCTAVLVTAFPAIIDASAPGENAVRVAALLFMLSLTRAPLLIPLQAMQGVAITAFVERRDAPLRALRPLILRILAISIALALAAAALGPWALRLIAPVYDSLPLTWAGLTLAGGVIAILTLTGTAALAVDRHLVHASGWLLASIVGVLIMWLPWQLELRTVMALVVGPGLGIGLHVLALHLLAPHLPAPHRLPPHRPTR